MYIDLSSCVNADEQTQVAAIDMLPQKALDNVTPIDPEPLIEMMKQQQEQPKPPEIVQQQPKPPEQQQPEQPKPPAPPTPAPPKKMQVVETAKPDAFYARLTALAASGDSGAIDEVSSPDDNLQAVFRYLVKQ